MALFCICAFAQKNYDTPLRVIVPDGVVAAENQLLLTDRLQAVVTSKGMGSIDQATRFFVYPVFVELGNVLSGSVPPMHVVEMELSLYVADILNGKVYTQCTCPVKGVGRTDILAYRNAIKNISGDNPVVAEMFERTRSEIVSYYLSEGATIIADAKTCAAMNDYEKALYLLACIPSCCSGIYETAQEEMVNVYVRYVDYLAEKLLTQARALWASTQDREGAQEVISILNQIEPTAKCYPQAEELVAKISKRIGEEWELEKHLVYSAVELEKMRIEAAREVGVAYGTHQQPTSFLHYR